MVVEGPGIVGKVLADGDSGSNRLDPYARKLLAGDDREGNCTVRDGRPRNIRVGITGEVGGNGRERMGALAQQGRETPDAIDDVRSEERRVGKEGLDGGDTVGFGDKSRQGNGTGVSEQTIRTGPEMRTSVLDSGES